METGDLTIICVFIIFCVLVGAVAVTSNPLEKTQINVLSSSSLYNGEDIKIKLTTENGTPVANQTVNITLVDANGGRNVQTAIVGEDGIAILTLGGVTAGNYTLECSFGGNDKYKASNCTSSLEIKEEIKPEVSYNKNTYSSSNNYDSGAYYSTQYGKTFYSGDVVYDDISEAYYVHKGNNRWELL